MRRQFLFVELEVKNRQFKFFSSTPPHPHSSSALFFDRTLSFGCLRALRWISEVCCVFLIYKSSIPRSLASSSFLQHFKLFSSINISKHPQIRISSESLKSFNPKIFNQLLSPLSQVHVHNCVFFIFYRYLNLSYTFPLNVLKLEVRTDYQFTARRFLYFLRYVFPSSFSPPLTCNRFGLHYRLHSLHFSFTLTALCLFKLSFRIIKLGL